MSVLNSMFKMVYGLIKIPLIILSPFLVAFFAVFITCIITHILKGQRLPKRLYKRTREPSILKRLLIMLPRRICDDMYNRQADFFSHQGCIIFTGRQGMGKTISMVQFALRMKSEFPKSKLLTNLNITGQDAQLDHWRQLLDFKNGKKGVIVCMDETQNWFSSNQSRNFPPEMLSVITQNRKNRRIILGTAQNFYLLAKAIRSQATEVRECITLFGALTIVIKREPYLDSEGDVKEMKYRGCYFFVHSDKLRNSYDTYKVIESLQRSGFIENNLQLR